MLFPVEKAKHYVYVGRFDKTVLTYTGETLQVVSKGQLKPKVDMCTCISPQFSQKERRIRYTIDCFVNYTLLPNDLCNLMTVMTGTDRPYVNFNIRGGASGREVGLWVRGGASGSHMS